MYDPSAETNDLILNWIEMVKNELDRFKDGDRNECKRYEKEMNEEFSTIENELEKKEEKKSLENLKKLHDQFNKFVWSDTNNQENN